jgi:hypothetical protein
MQQDMEDQILKQAEESFITQIENRMNVEAQQVEKTKQMLDQNEVNDTLLSKALVKRKEWSEKYNVTDRDIYDLFSEFSSMMMIAKSLG